MTELTISKDDIESKKRELVSLKKKYKHEKEARKIERSKAKKSRDMKLDTIRGKLLEIKKLIYAYAKLGKTAKMDADILLDIRNLTFMEEEAPEEAENSSGPEENPGEDPEEVEEDGDNTNTKDSE